MSLYATGHDRPDGAGRRPRRRWALGNVAFLTALCALAGPGLAPGDETPAMGVVAAVCFLAPIRAASALAEWQLLRHYRHTGILLSHLAGLAIGAMLGTTPPSDLAATADGEPVTGWALAVLGYLLTTLIGLCGVLVVTMIRAKLRGGGPPAPPVGSGWSVSSLPALFWFNAVFIVAVGLLVAPGMAAQEHSSLTYGFTGGLLVGVILRTPGAWAEWWLTKRAQHRAVYSVHLAAGLLTALIVAMTVLSPTPEASSAVPDTAGTAIGVYLFLGSLSLLITAVVVGVKRQVRRHRPGSDPATTTLLSPGPVHRFPGPVHRFPGPVYRATARVPDPTLPSTFGTGADLVTTAQAVQPARPAEPAPRPEPAPLTEPAPPAERTEKLRNEVAVGLGIVVGLASLVQGYDSADPYRTVVVALAIGVIGLGIIFGTTIRR